MRNCGNCYNGHYNLSDRGEELYCDESGFMEVDVKEEENCEYHRYYPGTEEEKNYVFYDESFIAPGYLIVNIKNGKMDKFLKFYNASQDGFPLLGVRAYSKSAKEDPDEDFSSIDFSFRDLEDDENGLFKLFTNLWYDLVGERIFAIDSFAQGKNNLKLDSNSRVTKITLYKDTYHGTQHPCDYIDILMGDEYTCDDYDSIIKFWQGLSKICTKKISSDEVKKLILTK